MYCPYCGAPNQMEGQFCTACGQPLPTTKGTHQNRLLMYLAGVAAGLFLCLAVMALGAFAMRDRLTRAWLSLITEPTPIAVAPTSLPTEVPTQPTNTPLPSPSPSPTVALPTPNPFPTATQMPTPRPRTFALVYRQCIPHGFSLGSVKGQVFDKKGKVIPGAKVRITINGYEWKSDANPATTNADGWYEWTLEPGQKVKFVDLMVDGRSVPFAPRDLEVVATGGCFQRIDFVEQ